MLLGWWDDLELQWGNLGWWEPNQTFRLSWGHFLKMTWFSSEIVEAVFQIPPWESMPKAFVSVSETVGLRSRSTSRWHGSLLQGLALTRCGAAEGASGRLSPSVWRESWTWSGGGVDTPLVTLCPPAHLHVFPHFAEGPHYLLTKS